MLIREIRPNIEIAEFDGHESRLIDEAVNDLAEVSGVVDEAVFLDKLGESGKEIALSLPHVEEYFTDLSQHRGAKVTLVDLTKQTQNVPPTPMEYPPSTERGLYQPDAYRALVLGIAGLYGYGFETMQGGRIHNNIIPVQEHADTVGHNASSNHTLGLHNEVASFNLSEKFNVSPDFLSLHFYRNNKDVPTVVSTYDVEQLETEVRDLLSEPWFVNHTSPAQGGSNNAVDVPVSVLYGPESDPWSRISTSRMRIEDYTREQQDALKSFVSHLESRTVELPVMAGFLAMIDNRRVLHGRPAYREDQKPKYDGTDRWQRRITASNDPDRIQAFESRSRVVDMSRFRQQAKSALGQSDAQQ